MSKRRTFVIGQTVRLRDNTEWVIVAWGAGQFRLRDEVSGQYRLADHLELSRLLAPGEQLATAEEERPALTIAEVEDALSGEAKLLIPHLQELIDGSPAVGDEPREEYSLALPMTWRMKSKLDELHDLGVNFEIATLKRRLKRFKEEGPAGLVDRRMDKSEEPLARVEEEVKEELVAILAGLREGSDRTVTAIRAALARRLLERFPDAEKRPKTPSIRSMQRYVLTLTGEKKTARQRKLQAAVPNRQFRPRQVSAPGEECQIDSTTFDAWVLTPGGSKVRPELTILTDKRTKSILGFHFSEGKPSGFDLAMLIGRSLVPSKLRPWAKRYEELNLPRMPWSEYLDEEQQSVYDTHRPFIYPVRIVTDNGKEFKSRPFVGACNRAGITVTESPYAQPTTKGGVERTFGTIKTKFAQHLPGFTGGSVENKGKKPEDDPGILDLKTVSDLFDRWVAVVWQNRRHDSLDDPWDPSVRHTPNTMYAASVELGGHFTVALEPEDFVSAMPTMRRTVQADGIARDGRTYDSPHLAPLRNRYDADGKPARVDVYYDPSDPYQVWVRSPLDGEWITCRWTDEAGFSRPMEDALMANARRLTRENGGFTDEQADDLLVEMHHQAAAEAEALKKEQVQKLKDRLRRSREAGPLSQILEPVDVELDPSDITHLEVA